MKIQMATLTNGAKVPVPSVQQTLMHLDDMVAAHGVMPIYELLEVCKDPDHRPFGTMGDNMNDFGLLTEWDPSSKRAVVHDFTRDVVLAAIQGQDLSIVRQIIVSTEEVDV
jgi:hypothetical protein